MPTSILKNKAKKNIVGITLGDPGGIGPEIITKSLMDKTVRRSGRYLIVGSREKLRKLSSQKFSNIEIIDPYPLRSSRPGIPTIAGARASLNYLKTAIGLIKNGKINGLVTAPICKETAARVHLGFQGHTEFLADEFKIKNVGMIFVSGPLKTMIITRHMPLARVSRSLTAKKIYEAIALCDQSLKSYFRLKNPRLAVCGVNPHAGEGGTLGSEENRVILPAIRKAQKKNIKVDGPFSADTIFIPQNKKNYDAVIAMYHDQGLIPMKSMYFDQLVNLTVGLPFVRTSPAHGTAFDIAGKGKAEPSSMKAAIRLAAQLAS